MPFRYNPITGELDIVDIDTATGYLKEIDADAGSALPVADIINLIGNATQGTSTSATGNTVTISGINATAAATSLLATKGVSSFDSTHFTVTDGFVTLSGGTGAETFLTDDGAPAVEPDASGQLNILGGVGVDVTGQGPGNTVTVSGHTATADSKGITELATDSEVVSGTLTDYHVVNPSSLKAKLGVQTAQGVMIGKGTTAAMEATAAGTLGELLIANTGANPAFGSTAYGNFAFSQLAVGVPRTFSVNNTDDNVASTANIMVSVPDGGADGYFSWEIMGTRFYAFGPDNSVAGDPMKLTNSSEPSAGTALLTLKTGGDITFNEAYEFPIADGNASEVLISDGGGNLDWGTVSSIITDLDNILFVGKHGADANNGKTASNAKLTFQAAVTAAAVGDTIVVFPGTYTETVTHAANNVTVIANGKSNTCIITQADANVIDFATFTGIQYKYFGISCTAATTAINTVQGSTGSCTFKECQLKMTCATDIAAAAQPAVGAITGNLGELKITIGKVTYAHTGNGGATANKGAFKVSNGGEITLQRINDCSIANSGTALVSGVGIDTDSTGVFLMNDNKITVTDPNSTVVVGLAYLGGTGTTHEFFRNTVHVNATNNIGYGFFSADTASTSRFFYNHLHVTDVAGSSYSYLIGNTATVVSQFDDIIAADGISLTAGGNFTCVSSEMDGDLTCRGREASGIVQANIMNMDNTATAGNAACNISVGGATSTGDPYSQWLITGSTAFSAGMDNSDADAFKVGPNINPSTGTSSLEIAAANGAITFNEAYTFPVADGNADDVLTTDGSGAVTWEAGGGGGGLTWTLTTVNASLVVANGYIANKVGVLAMTLPDTSAVGTEFAITNFKQALGWSIVQGENQYIRMGSSITTVGAGGSLASVALGDTIHCICTETDLGWQVISSTGNITVV